ncbi:MAG: LON peptidase substrate-binding domain-containing protein [Ardenticatenaceae bacterium]|nr:LON peptidase substrate-binding domain-containing protein [Ardenticatenaceae bacterium]
MIDLPLFPLNTVLFPNMPITLHIFEERYKQMINTCITENEPFGVVLIQNGEEAGGSAKPRKIGCTANIAQVQPLSEGRMNLVGLGEDRFEIISLSYDKPYLVGSVEILPFVPPTGSKIVQIGQRLNGVLSEYLEVLANFGEVQFNVDKLPEDPLELAYLSATILQAPNEDKQTLLEIDNGDQFIRQVYHTTRKEIAILKAMLAPNSAPAQEGPFSLN